MQTHDKSVTGHIHDRLVAFGVPRVAGKSYAPVMSVALLARDARWPHGEDLFTQLFDCSLIGEITQFKPVGRVYRQKNVVLIKRMRKILK